MTAAAQLLAELHRRGVELQAHGDRLRFRPTGAVTPDLRDQLARHKAELLLLLRPGPPPEGPRVARDCPGTIAHAPPGRVGQPEAPHELSLAERVESGYVNPGWLPHLWAARLRQLADRCEVLHPELAAQYRTWAANCERKGIGLA